MKPFEIIERIMAVPNIHKMVIHAPDIAAKARPGQFVIIIPDEKGERVPFTISDRNEDEGTITVFFQELGVSTMKLACMQEGEALEGVVGPLGTTPDIKNFGTVMVAGGCYGIGAVYPLARALKEAGNNVITIIEARSKYLFYNLEKLRTASDTLIMATTDGSTGITGKAHSVIRELASGGQKLDRAYFMGCNFMLMRCSDATRELKIPTQVALNALMVDGTGMCGCCRVTAAGQTKYACVDGPWFDGHTVDWEELFRRSGHYLGDEAMAYHHYSTARCKQDSKAREVD